MSVVAAWRSGMRPLSSNECSKLGDVGWISLLSVEMIISAERIAGLQNESANKQTGEYEQRVECCKALTCFSGRLLFS